MVLYLACTFLLIRLALSMISTSNSRTALMVFSLSASQEAGRKQVLGKKHKKSSGHLFKILIENTAQIAQASGIDVVWVDEKKQKGSDFATRFTNAFKDLYAQGYDNVISIGNDCPDLTVAHIKLAIDQLQHNKLVLGPAKDGGVYLIGINRSLFDAQQFYNLPWQKDILFDDITNKAQHEGLIYFCLDTLQDIDSQEDVLSYARQNPFTRLTLFLKNVFVDKNPKMYGFNKSLFFLKPKDNFSLRAPPYSYSAA